MARDKGDGTSEKPGTLSERHTHSDGSDGWDFFSKSDEKEHLSLPEDEDKGFIAGIVESFFGKK